ncbi:hypothetical protein DB30_02741 [Enhygromyxa salina]|uniref:Uncharacterized protein n=1 Tax=Enhygromyxa salina TaxID=215803 RepID=A0A0C2DDD6_9BACT|nr:hypothetical protein [Enhygromyxa salina]KIG19460.1 hypothetical protein DB30_02741 [Enhygromyxa salina]
MPAYLSKPPPAVETRDPRGDHAKLLRTIEAAKPAALRRVWVGKRATRRAHLEGVFEHDGARFLHVPWLRQPQLRIPQAVFNVLGVVAGAGVAVVSFARGRLISAFIVSIAVGSGIIGYGFNRRSASSRRIAEPDGGPGLPGFICLDDRLLLRYPDALYEIPRERIAKISKRAKVRQAGETAMGEYDLAIEFVGGGEPLIVAEVVDLRAHEAADSDERMGLLGALVTWLDEVWLRGGDQADGAPRSRLG